MISNWPLPPVSIVIEWDNVRTSELARAHEMLRALRGQIAGLRTRMTTPPEILLLYDRTEVDPAIIQGALDEAFQAPDDLCRVRIVPVEGLRYYELKNAGAAISTGDVVVFADSDAIPRDGWLEALLESFTDPDVQVVGGQTYMALNSLYSKAFALFWFFGVRSERADLAEESWFFANNVAFRRTVLERFPFPSGDLYRGNCAWLAETLRKNGIKIFRQYRAESEHPPPIGVRNFVARALWEGHDNVAMLSLYRQCTWREIACLHLRSLRDMVRRARRDGGRAGLTAPQVPAALAIGVAYAMFKLTGAVLTQIDRGLLRRYLKA